MGTEIYWHGILDYSGRDNRRLSELKEIHEKAGRMACVAGSRYQAKVGLVRDYDNLWDSVVDAWHGRVERESGKGLFEACQRKHTPFDFCYLDHMKAGGAVKISGSVLSSCNHADTADDG